MARPSKEDDRHVGCEFCVLLGHVWSELATCGKVRRVWERHEPAMFHTGFFFTTSLLKNNHVGAT
jgi:hypothetical protein